MKVTKLLTIFLTLTLILANVANAALIVFPGVETDITTHNSASDNNVDVWGGDVTLNIVSPINPLPYGLLYTPTQDPAAIDVSPNIFTVLSGFPLDAVFTTDTDDKTALLFPYIYNDKMRDPVAGKIITTSLSASGQPVVVIHDDVGFGFFAKELSTNDVLGGSTLDFCYLVPQPVAPGTYALACNTSGPFNKIFTISFGVTGTPIPGSAAVISDPASAKIFIGDNLWSMEEEQVADPLGFDTQSGTIGIPVTIQSGIGLKSAVNLISDPLPVPAPVVAVKFTSVANVVNILSEFNTAGVSFNFAAADANPNPGSFEILFTALTAGGATPFKKNLASPTTGTAYPRASAVGLTGHVTLGGQADVGAHGGGAAYATIMAVSGLTGANIPGTGLITATAEYPWGTVVSVLLDDYFACAANSVNKRSSLTIAAVSLAAFAETVSWQVNDFECEASAESTTGFLIPGRKLVALVGRDPITDFAKMVYYHYPGLDGGPKPTFSGGTEYDIEGTTVENALWGDFTVGTLGQKQFEWGGYSSTWWSLWTIVVPTDVPEFSLTTMLLAVLLAGGLMIFVVRRKYN